MSPQNNARDWSQIVEHYARFADQPWGAAMHELVAMLQSRGYVATGLYGTTSMSELLLGRSRDVLNNPHLRVRPGKEVVELVYDDGSDPPWSAEVGFDELPDRVERFLLKRGRWFQSRS
jgi:hypothetical protein